MGYRDRRGYLEAVWSWFEEEMIVVMNMFGIVEQNVGLQPHFSVRSFCRIKTTAQDVWSDPNAVKLSRSLSGVEAILLTSAPLSQRFILPGGA